jgi:hypothetical protein
VLFGSLAPKLSHAEEDKTPDTASISYDDFVLELNQGGAKKVQFYGAFGEDVILTLMDGTRLSVRGVKKYDPSSPLGPERTVAKVRDAKVPFSFETFDLYSFRKVPDRFIFFSFFVIESFALLFLPCTVLLIHRERRRARVCWSCQSS